MHRRPVRLSFIRGAESARDVGFVEYLDAHPAFDPLASHPDLGLMLPGSRAQELLRDTLPRLTEAELGPIVARAEDLAHEASGRVELERARTATLRTIVADPMLGLTTEACQREAVHHDAASHAF